MADVSLAGLPNRRPFALRYPSVLVFIAALALFTLTVTFLSEAMGNGAAPVRVAAGKGHTQALASSIEAKKYFLEGSHGPLY